MDLIIIIVFLIIILIILQIVYDINFKKIKEIAENNKKLDDEIKKYPSNIEICKSILKKLKNEDVEIVEEKNAGNCLYIAITNKIIIANMRDSFTRVQTIAHECLHSIQNRRILIFNYIFSNIYILSFFIIAILSLTGIIKEKMLFLMIYMILGFIHYFVKSYLENDAMIKARFVAKQYLKEQKISNNEDIENIINEYDNLNSIGIKAINYDMFLKICLKTIILAIIMLINT